MLIFKITGVGVFFNLLSIRRPFVQVLFRSSGGGWCCGGLIFSDVAAPVNGGGVVWTCVKSGGFSWLRERCSETRAHGALCVYTCYLRL